MRSARYFLACAAVFLLAACGTDPLSPEAADTGAARRDENTSGISLQCAGTLVTKTLTDGTTATECVTEANKQAGSGG